MAYTQTDLDNLDAAILASELEVELEGRRVRYHSKSELLKVRQLVAGVLAGAAASSTRRTSFYPQFTTARGD
jgi:hypothetical protein